MFSSLRILAALFLWQALVMTAIAPAGATGVNQAIVGAPSDNTAFATDNRGPRQLLGTAQTISAL